MKKILWCVLLVFFIISLVWFFPLKIAAFVLEIKYPWLDVLNTEVLVPYTPDNAESFLIITLIKNDLDLDSNSIPKEDVWRLFDTIKTIAKYLHVRYATIDRVLLLLCSWQPYGSVYISYESSASMKDIEAYGNKAVFITVPSGIPLNLEKAVWRGRFK